MKNLGGGGAGIRGAELLPRGFLSREAAGGGSSARTWADPASLAFTYILASWSLGAGHSRWASRSLHKKKRSKNNKASFPRRPVSMHKWPAGQSHLM